MTEGARIFGLTLWRYMDTTLIHNIVMFLTLKKTNQINIILLQYFNTKKVFKTHFPYFHMILNY
jgi:hypothetical protein